MGNIEEIHFREGEFELSVCVEPRADTVWLNRQQMAQLFARDVKTIVKHIQSALREELDDSVVAKFATTAGDGKTYQVEYYNLDMIISVSGLDRLASFAEIGRRRGRMVSRNCYKLAMRAVLL